MPKREGSCLFLLLEAHTTLSAFRAFKKIWKFLSIGWRSRLRESELAAGPTLSTSLKRVSKVATLRRAIDYIRLLQNALITNAHSSNWRNQCLRRPDDEILCKGGGRWRWIRSMRKEKSFEMYRTQRSIIFPSTALHWRRLCCRCFGQTTTSSARACRPTPTGWWRRWWHR